MIILAESAATLSVLLIATGMGPALVLGASRPSAMAVTPAAGSAACAVAVALSVLTGTSMVPWLVAIGIAGWATALRLGSTHHLLLRSSRTDARVLAAAVAVSLIPLLLVRYPTTTWDARRIWWFHAEWFRAGGSVAGDVMRDPAFRYSNPDYPPLVPGVIAGVWHLRRAYDLEVALRVTQWLTAYGVAALSFYTTRTLRLRGTVAVIIAVVVAWVAWSARLDVGIQGLVDQTWALFLTTAAVLILAGDADRRTVWTGALFAALAALTKNEGQAAGLMLALTVAVSRASWRRAVAVLAGVAGAIGLWALAGPGRDKAYAGDWSRSGDLLSFDTVIHDRLVMSLRQFAVDLGPLVALGVLSVLAIVILGSLSGTPVRQPGTVALLVFAGVFTLFSATVFAVRPEEIDLLLTTTAYRVMIVVRLLVMVDVVLAAVGACRALGLLREPSPTRYPSTSVPVAPGVSHAHSTPDGTRRR